MISDLIQRGEPIRDYPPLKGDQGRSQCQGFQLIRVFGTYRGEGSDNFADHNRIANIALVYLYTSIICISIIKILTNSYTVYLYTPIQYTSIPLDFHLQILLLVEGMPVSNSSLKSILERNR